MLSCQHEISQEGFQHVVECHEELRLHGEITHAADAARCCLAVVSVEAAAEVNDSERFDKTLCNLQFCGLPLLAPNPCWLQQFMSTTLIMPFLASACFATPRESVTPGMFQWDCAMRQ